MRPEHRGSRRCHVLHGARIALADGSAVQSCRMLDISGTGACLQVKEADAVPDQFVLLLSRDGRLQRQCSVVWRSEKTVGVEFVPDCPPTSKL